MLSQPPLPGDSNNWRQNCFRIGDFFWRGGEGMNVCFCSSTQCHVGYAPPDGWNCFVISQPLWCWHRNLLLHSASWDFHHLDEKKRGEKKTPYPSINVTLQQLMTEWKYLHVFPEISLKTAFPGLVSFSKHKAGGLHLILGMILPSTSSLCAADTR